MKKKFTFKKIKNFESARFGKISTSKGNIDTPAFMPVGTIANVKAMFPENISRIPSGTGPGSREMHEFPHFPAGLGRGWMLIIPNDFRKV